MPQLRRQLEAQAPQQVDIAALAQGLAAFGPRRQPPVNQLTFAHRRPLVALLFDHVSVTRDQGEMRYVVPPGPMGAPTPCGHVR